VLIEELFDLSSLDENPVSASDRLGELLEAGAGLADELHQDQNRNFRWKLNDRQTLGALALDECRVGIDGKVDVRAADLVPLQSALPTQLNEYGMASAPQLCPKLFRTHTSRAAGGQIHQRIGKAA